MATETTTETVKAGAKVRGFGSLPCPKCGEESNVRIFLDDLETCQCGECDGEFDIEDIRVMVAAWTPVLAWLDTVPNKAG